MFSSTDKKKTKKKNMYVHFYTINIKYIYMCMSSEKKNINRDLFTLTFRYKKYFPRELKYDKQTSAQHEFVYRIC